MDLLVVCAANVCRSPLAEYLLTEGMRSIPEFEGHSVSSAGVSAALGSAICPRVEEHIGAEGASFATAHRSRPVTKELLARSGLVLTASKAERSAVARLDPSARSRTFTLREAAVLAELGGGNLGGGNLGGGNLGAELGAPDVDGTLLDRFAALAHARRGLGPVAVPRKRSFPFLRSPSGDPLDVLDGHVLGDRAHDATIIDVGLVVDRLLAALRAVGV